jgi:hypothetical protein
MITGSENMNVAEITVPKSYNPRASRPEEHLMNLKFQLVQVEFWLSNGDKYMHSKEHARIKSACLLEAAEKLVAAFRNECGREPETGLNP